MFVIVAQC